MQNGEKNEAEEIKWMAKSDVMGDAENEWKKNKKNRYATISEDFWRRHGRASRDLNTHYISIG